MNYTLKERFLNWLCLHLGHTSKNESYWEFNKKEHWHCGRCRHIVSKEI